MPTPITVTTLIENSPSGNKDLLHEHGLSFQVKVDDQTIIFDCGASDRLLHNAKVLGVDWEGVDTVVLSHSHYDHGGGFPAVVEKCHPNRLITGPDYFLPKYSRAILCNSYAGVPFDPTFLEVNNIRHEECRDVIQLNSRCWVVGGFKQIFPEETVPSRFRRRREGILEPDDFSDEVCLALRMHDGLAVLVGCAHRGIINILTAVREALNLPIRGVWGGVHLRKAKDARLSFTLEQLKRMGVRQAGFCHCSGDAIQAVIEKDGVISASNLHTGDMAEIGS